MDSEPIGKAFEGLFRLAMFGAAASLILSVLAVIGAIAGIIWAFRHVNVTIL